jgi:serine/threonine-protein kinase RsbW
VSSPAKAAAVKHALMLDGNNSSAEAVACFVGRLASEADLPHGKAYWLRLAAEEITTNISQHGYLGPGPIWLTGEITAETVQLRIEDEAPAFDPLKHDRHARLAVEPAEREAGGFGLLLAIHRLDGFSYRHADGRNCNTLIMCREQPAAARN